MAYILKLKKHKGRWEGGKDTESKEKERRNVNSLSLAIFALSTRRNYLVIFFRNMFYISLIWGAVFIYVFRNTCIYLYSNVCSKN